MMNRRSLRPLMLLLTLAGACGGTTKDMTVSTPDLGTAAGHDMAAAGSTDMAVTPPKLMGVSCTAATVNAATVYSTIIMNKCSGMGCHRGTGASQLPMFGNSSAEFIAAVVGKASSATMNYITASDIDNSYLLYKVLNQQFNVPGGSGGQMPENAAALSTAEVCTLVNWVRSGAK